MTVLLILCCSGPLDLPLLVKTYYFEVIADIAPEIGHDVLPNALSVL